MPKVIDVSHWSKEVHLNTSGTREKFILTSPKDEKYYFKNSYKTKNRYYKFEFWSEVIASEIGQMLKFDVVTYDIGYYENVIGCISKSIIDEKVQELHEGYRHIVEKFPDFQHNFKDTHSFQRIIKSLENMYCSHCVGKAIEMIIFDAIIGNTDRHSENWALVINSKDFYSILQGIKKFSWIKRAWININLYIKYRLTHKRVIKTFRLKYVTFSPLYDNGSSLGRELTDDVIADKMADKSEIEKFIDKGKSDIRWDSKKLNHFDLIEAVKYEYGSEVSEIISRVKKYYNKNKLINIVNNVDKKVPPQFKDYKLTEKRKEFIIESVDLRIKRLIKI